MVLKQNILSFVDGIVSEFHPKRIILFGSYANGEATQFSDVDLLIEMKRKPANGLETVGHIIEKLKPSFPVDLIVHSTQQIKSRLRQGDFFLRDIVSKGEKLYECTR
jgi:uncharacterized protein